MFGGLLPVIKVHDRFDGLAPPWRDVTFKAGQQGHHHIDPKIFLLPVAESYTEMNCCELVVPNDVFVFKFTYECMYCHDAPVRPQDPLSECISNAVVNGFVSTTDEELVLRDKETQGREREMQWKCLNKTKYGTGIASEALCKMQSQSHKTEFRINCLLKVFNFSF